MTQATVPIMVKYKPLSPAVAEIRLFILSPGQNSTPLRGHLRTVSLDEDPEFEALSYVWGDPADRESITLEDEPFPVTHNLHAALHTLRRHDSQRTLWIDAICINQHDVGEKNTQVPLMARIYTDAGRVIAWLGPATERIKLAISWLNSSPGSNLDPAAARYWLDLEREAATSQMGELNRHYDLVKSYLGTRDVFALPYWFRMWTFQEFRLPPQEPVCICGDLEFRASALYEGRLDCKAAIDDVALSADYLSSVLRPEVPDPPERDNTDDRLFLSGDRSRDEFQNLRYEQQFTLDMSDIGPSSIRTNHADSFVTFLVMTCHRASQDPRDGFFALYGISPKIREVYPADYGKEYARVEIETTAFLTNVDPYPRLIYDAYGVMHHSLRSTACPSWIPDFGQLIASGSPIREKQHSLNVHLHGKALTQQLLNLQGNPAAHICKDLRTLTIYGKSLGPVRAMPFANSKENVIVQAHSIFQPNVPIPVESWCRAEEECDKAHSLGSLWVADYRPTRDMQPDELCKRIARLMMALDEGVNANFSFEIAVAFFRNCLDVANNAEWYGTGFQSLVGDKDTSLVSLIADCTYFITGKTLLATRDGIIGIGMSGIEDGDILVLSPEMSLLLVLHPFTESGGSPYYKIAGTAYVDGLMDGYALDAELVEEIHKREWQAFSIR